MICRSLQRVGRGPTVALAGLLIAAPLLATGSGGDPRVALVVLGHPNFADALHRELDRRLGDAGFEVVDGRGALPPAGAWPSVAELVPRLADRAELLVAVEIEVLGERELDYLGRQETLFRARLDLRAWSLAAAGAVEGSWSEEVEYTAAMAAAKAGRCFDGLMPELSQTLRRSWDESRRRLAAAAARQAAGRKEAAATATVGSGPRRPAPPPPAAADPLAAYEAGDYAAAAGLWGAACDGGETIACYNLGLIYLDGAEGVARDSRRAAELFQRSCDDGEAAGCFNLAAMYASGDGIPRDPQQSAALFRRACGGGAEAACFNLGLLYFSGDGVLPRDLRQAAELFRQACDGGYAPGCFNLGTLYGNSEAGLPRDDRRAAELFRRACDGGEDLGCVHLELLCESRPAACESWEPR